jgi:hypothetical protein
MNFDTKAKAMQSKYIAIENKPLILRQFVYKKLLKSSFKNL